MTEERVYSDKQVVIVRMQSPKGLALSGAIDLFNADAVATALRAELRAGRVAGNVGGRATSPAGDLHVDVSRVDFADVTAIRALVAVAENGDGSHRMVLHGMPPSLVKVMAVVGWVDLPNLAFED